MSSNQNEEPAANNQNPSNNSVSTGNASGVAAASGGTDTYGLESVFKSSAPLLTPLRPINRELMVQHSRTMFKSAKEIKKRLDTQMRFVSSEGNDAAMHVDTTTGSEVTATHIVHSFRGDKNKFILGCSKLIQNDERFSDERAEYQGHLDEGDAAYFQYQTTMSNIAISQGMTELKARYKDHKFNFIDFLRDISIGITVEIRRSDQFKHRLNTATNPLSSENMACAVAMKFINTVGDKVENFWKQLAIFDGEADINELDFNNLKSLYLSVVNINYDGLVEPHLTGNNPPAIELEIINTAVENLIRLIPAFTIIGWDIHVKSVIAPDETDAELEEIFGRLKVDKANQELDEDMDVGGPEEHLDGVLDKKIDKKLASAAAKKKAQQRKNSGGGGQTSTPPEPTSNGQNSRRNSDKNKHNSRKRSPKRSRANSPSPTPNPQQTGKKGKKKKSRGAAPGGSDLVVSPHTTFVQREGGSQGGANSGGRGNNRN